MNMRPASTCWFELLTTHDDLIDTLGALAHTESIELELHNYSYMQMDLQDMQQRLLKYTNLERQYKPLWPKANTSLSPFTGSPAEILDKALDCIFTWEKKVRPEIQRLTRVKNKLDHMLMLRKLVSSGEASKLDYSLLNGTGLTVAARLYLLPSHSRFNAIPETIIWKQYSADEQQYLLLVGTVEDLNKMTTELALTKYTYVDVPPLPVNQADALQLINRKTTVLRQHDRRLQLFIDELAVQYHLAQALGEIQRMEWFLKNVPALPVSRNLAWISGWTTDCKGETLQKTLALQGSRAVLHFPEAPAEIQPPLMLINPWWAKPFEIFTSMLGTPGRDEADPSRLLALLVPLIFGYMFGDVGQGLVLMLTGFLLQNKWPLLRILIPNGISAMMFGFVFGSIFGREDLLPAFWLHPLSQPLAVLAVPVLAGIVVILLGMILSAFERNWHGEWLRWLHVEAPVIVIYLGILSLLINTGVAMVTVFCALTWYLIGSLLLNDGRLSAMPGSAGHLLETLMQLSLNTLSFVRVGAFALAHAGLSMAFNIMADGTNSALLTLLILLTGNLLVIALEGLVVSIQTTRLILFEFFIRFLQANGRVFKPLRGPAAETINN
jgi:V/A-type H+-transporting ATPase subunit I